jgi:hypothetical protein
MQAKAIVSASPARCLAKDAVKLRTVPERPVTKASAHKDLLAEDNSFGRKPAVQLTPEQ